MRFHRLTSALLCIAELSCVRLRLNAQSSQPAPLQFRVAGKVVNKNKSLPLAQVRVTLRHVKDPKNVRSTLTGEDGRFEFLVPAGKYNLSGAKRGFVTASYDQHEQFSSAIVTGAGVDTENLVMKLSPMAMVSGRVLDEVGEPVRRAQVLLWRQTHQTGVNRIVRFRGDASDDLGGYEFAGLDGGTYFLSVSAQPWYAVYPPTTTSQEGEPRLPVAVDRALDVVYPTIYYADATESDDATPIPIRGGEHIELDLRMRPVAALHIVYRQEVKEGELWSFPVIRRRAFDDVEPQHGPDGAQVTAPGVAEMVVAPGKYTIRLMDKSGTGPATEEVDLTQDHQEVIASNAPSASNIRVTVHVEGEGVLPRGLFLILRDGSHTVDFEEVGGDWEVKFPNVAPGTYELIAGSPDRAYGVVEITADGQPTPGHRFTVAQASPMSLSVKLVAGSGVVDGVAERSGKGVAGAMVVLIPKDPENNRDRFRRDQSDLDGSFTLRDVIPGTYTVVAIADGWDLDWSRTAVISIYAAHGQKVVVEPKPKEAIQLREPIEVVAK